MDPGGRSIAADGAVVVAGPSDDGSDPPYEIVRRLTAKGAYDATFCTRGGVDLPAAPAPYAQSVSVSASGQVTIFGPTGNAAARTARLSLRPPPARWPRTARC